MKAVLVLLLALFAASQALPRPAETVTKDESTETEGDTELVDLPHGQRHPNIGFAFGFPAGFLPRRPYDHEDPFFPASPWGRPRPSFLADDDDDQAGSFITQMQEMLKEMRKQLTELANHADREHGLGEDDGLGTRIGADDLPINQTTSETKVIDGHVVTVNETTYTSGDDSVGAVFRIKVVEVHPSESPEDAEGEAKPDDHSSETPEVGNDNANKSEIYEDNNEENNEIPNPPEKVGSEVDDLNA